MPLKEYAAANASLLGVQEIKINTANHTPNEADDYQAEIAEAPQLYYCNVQIPIDSITSFTVDSTGFLPTLTLAFTDRTGIIADAGLPGDDGIITVRLPAKSKLLSFVHMNFKILSYTKQEIDQAQIFNMSCVASVNRMLIPTYSSWADTSSWGVLKAMAIASGLGFRSNVADSADKQTWLCPGIPGVSFVSDWVLPHAWAGENSYMWAFVDMYYNLTYVDVEKALQEDGFAQKGVVGTTVATNGEPVVGELVLTSDPAGKHTGGYFVRPTITNVSTETSLRNGYVRDAHFYDVSGNWAKKAGAFMQFTVDSITTPGAEKNSLILKGRPGDSALYESNRGRSWAGRIDTDNVFPDYAYATVQNEQNIGDLQKVSIMLRLPQPNMNLYRFQKIPVVLSNMSKPGVDSSAVNERLSGQWLITGFKFTFSQGNKLEQYVQCVKRELNVKDLSL